MLFRGTTHFGSEEIDQIFDAMGAEINAGTDKEATSLYTRVLDRHLERAFEVTIVGKDEDGNDVRYELEDYSARCVQHEADHLDGVLMIDRTTPEARREALGILRPRIVLN